MIPAGIHWSLLLCILGFVLPYFGLERYM